eukprot:scaffold145309_cov21-Prasinocladus_malaysianus.AAC.1
MASDDIDLISLLSIALASDVFFLNWEATQTRHLIWVMSTCGCFVAAGPVDLARVYNSFR